MNYNMMDYTLNIRNALYRKVSELPNVEEIIWSKRGRKGSVAIDNARYLRFNRGEDLIYLVHLTTYKSTEKNETMPPVYYTKFPRPDGWMIEASLADYNPDDVISAINEIDRCLEKHDIDTMMESGVGLALLYNFLPVCSEDYDEMVPKLTQKYMIENELDITEDSIEYQVLTHILTLILIEIEDDEYYL